MFLRLIVVGNKIEIFCFFFAAKMRIFLPLVTWTVLLLSTAVSTNKSVLIIENDHENGGSSNLGTTFVATR